MPPWTADAIRDSTAAIVEGLEYQRSLTRSLFSQIGDWLVAQVGRLVDLIPDVRLGPWILFGLVILLVALLALRAVMNFRAEREFRAGAPRNARRAVGLDPSLEAERLATAGAYLEAAQQLCAALLAASSRRGEITLHPSKTTGDYAREMRRRGASSERAFHEFRTRYDRVVYDLQACSAEEYDALRQVAGPMLRRELAA